MKMIDRQYPLHAVAKLNHTNIGAGKGVDLGLPANAVLLGVSTLTTVAFDGTTATATVGDGTTEFMAAVDIKAAGADVGTGVPKFYPTKGKVTVALGGTGTNAVGEVLVMLSYVIVGRGGEIQE